MLLALRAFTASHSLGGDNEHKEPMKAWTVAGFATVLLSWFAVALLLRIRGRITGGLLISWKLLLFLDCTALIITLD